MSVDVADYYSDLGVALMCNKACGGQHVGSQHLLAVDCPIGPVAQQLESLLPISLEANINVSALHGCLDSLNRGGCGISIELHVICSMAAVIAHVAPAYQSETAAVPVPQPREIADADDFPDRSKPRDIDALQKNLSAPRDLRWRKESLPLEGGSAFPVGFRLPAMLVCIGPKGTFEEFVPQGSRIFRDTL